MPFDLNKSNNSIPSVYLWNKEFSTKQAASFSLEPIDYTKEQIKNLYRLLYPMIEADFANRENVHQWANQMKKELDTKIKIFNTKLDVIFSSITYHVHPAPGGVTTLSATLASLKAELESWTTLPEQLASKFSPIVDNDLYKNTKHRSLKPAPSVTDNITPLISPDATRPKPFVISENGISEFGNFLGVKEGTI